MSKLNPEKKSKPGKKPIPGTWFLVVGAAMILMSVFIDVEKLLMFVLAGAVFIVIGFFKIVMKIEEEKLHAKKHHASHQHNTVHHSDNKTHPPHKVEHHTSKTEHGTHKTTHTSTSTCGGCGVKLHPAFKFCPNCGHKLR